mgnify:CR=1 FL=1
MAEELTIRRATISDVDDLVRLRYAMQIELAEGHHGVSPDQIVESTHDYFEKQLNGNHFAAFFALADGQIVGTGGFVVYDTPPSPSNPSGTEGYIMNMYTLPEWRKHGVATLILQALADHARHEGATRVWLRASTFGRKVYEHFGFEQRDSYMQMRLD